MPGRSTRMAGAVAGVLCLGACNTTLEQSLAQLEPATSLPAEPSGASTYLNMGRTLLSSGQHVQARAAFIRSLRTEGVTAAALSGAGIASERQGLLHDAKRFFVRARTLQPESILANNNLGVVQYRLGEYHAARRTFQAAFALSSGTNTVAEINLGLSEQAIERQSENALAEAANPVPIQRLGTSEYTLLAPSGKPTKPAETGSEG